MGSFFQILYSVSTVLLVPVIVALLGLQVWCLLEIGGFVREWHERRNGAGAWREFIGLIQNQSNPPEKTVVATFFRPISNYFGLLAAFSKRGQPYYQNALHLGKLVSDLEIEASARLSRMNLGTRVGPILGLMGTLIPMGPALIGLSAGNIEKMATSLVVAFSTTVLGLLAGGLCFTMSLTRRHWYSQDLSDIEYVYWSLHAEKGVTP